MNEIKNNLICVGRRVHYPGDICNKPGDGVIVEVHGEPQGAPKMIGGGVMILARANECRMKIVLFDGRDFGHTHESSFYGLRPWKFLDKVHGPEMIAATIARAGMVRAKAVADKDAADVAHKALIEKFIAENPHLLPVGKYPKGGNAMVAKNVRTALKHAGIKALSVRTERGSMVSSIRVSVAAEDVAKANEIGKRFEYGKFDGMTDCYDYDRYNAWCDAFGGVRYVFVERPWNA